MPFKDRVFKLTPEEVLIKKNFRKWLKKNLPPVHKRSAWFTDDLDLRYAAWKDWQLRLGKAGWIGLSWPKKYGGKGASNVCEFIIGDELAIHRAPYSGNWISLAAVAQAIINFGSEEQKKKYLPEIAKAEYAWCLGVTEPEAGSNVMATNTQAVLDGNHYIINGKKIWTTHSPRADRCLLLAKTGNHTKPEWNLSMFIVDLKSSGVTINPLRQLHGEENYGEMIFENVRIPKENIVGMPNGGWIIQATTWLQESIPPFDVPHRLGLRTLISDIRQSPLRKNAATQHRLAELAIDAEMIRLMTIRALRHQHGASGIALPSAAPLIKIAFTETTQKITEAGLDWSEIENRILWSPQPINWLYKHISARSNTLARAPSEIHRNFIARHYLGLPK